MKRVLFFLVVFKLVGLLPASSTSHWPDATRHVPATGPLAVASLSLRTAVDSAPPDTMVAHGLDLYRAHYCGTCHTLDKAGTRGIFGPTHNGMRATAEQRIADAAYTGVATTVEQYLRESIVEPTRYLVPGYEHTRYHMPAYTNLSDEDLTALVRMLLSGD